MERRENEERDRERRGRLLGEKRSGRGEGGKRGKEGDKRERRREIRRAGEGER